MSLSLANFVLFLVNVVLWTIVGLLYLAESRGIQRAFAYARRNFTTSGFIAAWIDTMEEMERDIDGVSIISQTEDIQQHGFKLKELVRR